MKSYRLENKPIVDADVEAAFQWYEGEEEGLGYEFLDELRAAYQRIEDGPLKYQVLRSGIRRAMTRRFPYAIYFSVEGEVNRGVGGSSRRKGSGHLAATY